jgi:CHAT domain-containing protein
MVWFRSWRAPPVWFACLLITAPHPASASNQPEPADRSAFLRTDPTMAQGFSADQVRTWIEEATAHATLKPDFTINQRESAVASMLAALTAARELGDPQVTCRALDQLIAKYGAEAIRPFHTLAGYRSGRFDLLSSVAFNGMPALAALVFDRSTNGDELLLSALAERFADVMRVERIAACTKALGASHPDMRRLREELAAFRRALHRGELLDAGKVDDISAPPGSEARFNIVLLRGLFSATIGDELAARRDLQAAELLIRTVPSDRPDLPPVRAGAAISMKILMHALLGDRQQLRALASEIRALPDSAGLTCELHYTIAAMEGRRHASFVTANPTCKNGGERDFEDLAQMIASARLGIDADPPPARRAEALPALRTIAAELRDERSRVSPLSYTTNKARFGGSGRDESALLGRFMESAIGAGGQVPPELGAELFLTMQELASGDESQAVALSEAQLRAVSADPALPALAAEYQRLMTMDFRLQPTNVPNAGQTPEARQRQASFQRLGTVTKELERRFPSYFALVNPNPITVAEAQAVLGPDEALLVTVPTPRNLYTVAVTKTDLRVHRSQWSIASVERAAVRLLWDLGAGMDHLPEHIQDAWVREGGEGYGFSRKLAYDLYQQSFGPLEPLLKDKKHLFVVSGGVMNRLPLGVLVTRPPIGGDSDPAALRSTAWLADRAALISMPSVQSLQLLRARRAATPADPAKRLQPTFIGIGDPIFEGAPIARRGGPSARADRRLRLTREDPPEAAASPLEYVRKLGRLPGSRTEIEQIRDGLQSQRSTVLLDADATEARVRDLNLARADLIVFATHGLVGGRFPGIDQATLALTPPANGQANPVNDGMLTASEVASLKMSSDLVVLSACNTAPSFGGLARAFFFAGANNLLVSHWPVRDDVAPRITVTMIRALREQPGLSRAQALQLAMRALRQDPSLDNGADTFAHPNAWAAFSILGEGS